MNAPTNSSMADAGNTVVLIVGTRPNIVKMAPLFQALKKEGSFTPKIVHAGQHYDADMSEKFFDVFDLPDPECKLKLTSLDREERILEMQSGIQDYLSQNRPLGVVVFGDVDASLAGALASKKENIPIVHVEAGLRSFDETMPEEMNRMIIDQLADVLCTTEAEARENLLREGVADKRIHFVGNIMIDSLKGQTQTSGSGVRNNILWTIHRPSNVDSRKGLKRVLSLLELALSHRTVDWPMHPRTKKRFVEFGLDQLLEDLESSGQLTITGPLNYTDFVRKMQTSAVIVTDSGGVQEEACVLGTPCLTVRNNTERPVTLRVGANELIIDADPVHFEEALCHALENDAEWDNPPLWDGKASQRIVEVLKREWTNVAIS